MNQQTLHIQIREGTDLAFWYSKAMNVIRAEALKQDLNWHDLQVVVELPRSDMILTKDPGHTILITRQQ